MVTMRVAVPLVIVCLNALIPVDADIGNDVVQKDFSAAKLEVFFSALDADRDGVVTLEDFHLRAACYIEKKPLDEMAAKRLREQEIPKAWKTLGFEKTAHLGIPITEDTLVATYEAAKQSPDFDDAMRSFFSQVFDVLRSFKSDNFVTLDDYSVMFSCLQPNVTSDEVTRESFDRMDDNNDGTVDMDEMRGAGIDFIFGVNESGDGTLFFGKPEL